MDNVIFSPEYEEDARNYWRICNYTYNSGRISYYILLRLMSITKKTIVSLLELECGDIGIEKKGILSVGGVEYQVGEEFRNVVEKYIIDKSDGCPFFVNQSGAKLIESTFTTYVRTVTRRLSIANFDLKRVKDGYEGKQDLLYVVEEVDSKQRKKEQLERLLAYYKRLSDLDVINETDRVKLKQIDSIIKDNK